MNLAHKYDIEDFDRSYKCFCLYSLYSLKDDLLA